MPEFTPTAPPEEPKRKPMELIQGHPLPPVPEERPLELTDNESLAVADIVARLSGMKVELHPNKNRKIKVYQLRLTQKQHDELTRKASFARVTVADFIRSRCGI